MVKLFCAIVGAKGSVFPVDIDASESVGDLKKEIRAKNPVTITCDADELQLFLAKKDGGAWLTENEVEKGVSDTSGMTRLAIARARLHRVGLSDDNVSGVTEDDEAAGKGPVNVLVEIPTEAAAVPAQRPVAPPEKKKQRTGPIFDPSALIKLTTSAHNLLAAEIGTVLATPETVFGTNLRSGLYIRQEYRDLYDMIATKLVSDQSLHRVLVVGSPGIGKSVFGIYWLLVSMAKQRNISYHPLGDPLTYYFTWCSTNGYEVSDTPHAGRTYDGLFDGSEAGGALRFDAFEYAFVFAGLRTTNYNEFVKESCFKVYMNPWTKAECQGFADAIGLENQDEWLRRFNLVGGKPRLLFSSSETFDDLEQRVKDAIPHNVDGVKDQARLFELKVFDDRMKHVLFHLYRNEDAPSRAYMTYSSLAVETIMIARYETGTADELRKLLRTPAPDLQSWRGKEIEKFLLQDLATSAFCVRALEGDAVGTVSRHGPFNARSTIIQAPSGIKNELGLYIPLSKTFPAVDGVLVVPDDRRIIYAQSTVATAHPIKYQHLKVVYQQLTGRGEFEGYTHILLFVVPDDIYDGFTVQAYKNTGTDGKSRTTRIDIAVMQYVGTILRQQLTFARCELNKLAV